MSLSSCRQSIIWRNLINPVYILQSPTTHDTVTRYIYNVYWDKTPWHWLTVTGVRTPQQRRQPWVLRSPAVRLVCPSPEPSPVQADKDRDNRHTLGQVFLVTTCHGPDTDSTTLLALSWLGCSLWRLFWFWSQRPMWKYRLGHCRVLAWVLLLPLDGAIFLIL